MPKSGESYITKQNRIIDDVCRILGINRKDYNSPIGIWAKLIKWIREQGKFSGTSTEQLDKVPGWVASHKSEVKKELEKIKEELTKNAQTRTKRPKKGKKSKAN